MTAQTPSASAARRGTASDPAPWAQCAVDGLPFAVLVMDRSRLIVYRNRWAADRLPPAESLDALLQGAQFLTPFTTWEAELAAPFDDEGPRRIECLLTSRGALPTRFVILHCLPLDAPPPAPRPPTGESASAAGYFLVTLVPQSQRPELEPPHDLARRLASLTTLTARLAHELNNPLDGILRYINLAIRLAGEQAPAKLRSYLNESRVGLVRMLEIVRDLAEFSRNTDGEFTEVNVNEVVEQAIAHAAADAAGVVVAADFQRNRMPCTRGPRLYQVCCNLLKNAVEAMPGGGRLSVTTGLVGGDVVIRVADTGCGLPVDADRIFEPFFTTKRDAEGTGLGLAISRDYVEQMGGTITAAPGEEAGAVFTVRIPAAHFHEASRLAAGIEASVQAAPSQKQNRTTEGP